MVLTRQQQKAIFSKRTKSGKTITITEGRDFFQGKDIYKVSGTDFAGTDAKFTDTKARAFEIANAKVRSENEKFERQKKMMDR